MTGTSSTPGSTTPPPRPSGLPSASAAANPKAYRADAAQHIYALNAQRIHKGRLPAMLVFASEDPNQFKSTHGTDLLAFFAGAFERAMRRWLG